MMLLTLEVTCAPMRCSPKIKPCVGASGRPEQLDVTRISQKGVPIDAVASVN
jgi:hypothetical protein